MTNNSDVAEGVLSAIGNTPLIRLRRLLGATPFQVFAKMELLNPGGSLKDRPALQMIKTALDTGLISTGGLVIESSSGNMAIGLAQACLYFGLKLICVVDSKTTEQNLQILRAYGTTIDLVERPDPVTGEFLQARLNRVRELLELFPEALWPNQYSNKLNSDAHHQTMAEITTALHGKVDVIFCATSTCGTLRGCAEYIRAHQLKTKVYAVDAVGSVIFGNERCTRLIPGHGTSICPKLFEPWLARHPVLVSDLECLLGCRHLLQSEAILAGGSSGAVVAALERVKEDISPGANCVLILPDRGERYLNTVYSDLWVRKHFGDVIHMADENHKALMARSA